MPSVITVPKNRIHSNKCKNTQSWYTQGLAYCKKKAKQTSTKIDRKKTNSDLSVDIIFVEAKHPNGRLIKYNKQQIIFAIWPTNYKIKRNNCKGTTSCFFKFKWKQYSVGQSVTKKWEKMGVLGEILLNHVISPHTKWIWSDNKFLVSLKCYLPQAKQVEKVMSLQWFSIPFPMKSAVWVDRASMCPDMLPMMADTSPGHSQVPAVPSNHPYTFRCVCV